jgi:hypothetical protein
MKWGPGLVFCLIAAGFTLQPNPNHADLAPVAVKEGHVLPLAPHETIRLDYEEVSMRLRKTGYTVDATFRFFNTGETMTQWVGVPKHVDDISMSPFTLDFDEFGAWVDGRPALFSEADDVTHPLSPDGRYVGDRRWMIGQVTFRGHATTNIRIRYEAGSVPVYYVFGTGRYWKDQIGKAAFTIDTTDLGDIKEIMSFRFPAAPGPRTITKNVVRYELGNFEPERDAQIRLLPHYEK